MSRTLRQSFFYHTQIKHEPSSGHIWNSVKEWQGYTLGTVMWHTNRAWKLLPEGATIKEVEQRSYEPLDEFNTQEELWERIKELETEAGRDWKRRVNE